MNEISESKQLRDDEPGMRPDIFMRPVIFVECTNTYHSSAQTGIQRVVRNIMRHSVDLADLQGYDLVPVVFEQNAFRVAEIGQVLRDKLRFAPPPPPQPAKPSWFARMCAPIARSPKASMLVVLIPIYRAIRRGLAAILILPACRRFLFADPADFGFAWCVLQPVADCPKGVATCLASSDCS